MIDFNKSFNEPVISLPTSNQQPFFVYYISYIIRIIYTVLLNPNGDLLLVYTQINLVCLRVPAAEAEEFLKYLLKGNKQENIWQARPKGKCICNKEAMMII